MRTILIATILSTSLLASGQFKPRIGLTVLDGQSIALGAMYTDRINDISFHPGMGGSVGMTDGHFYFNVGYNYRDLTSAFFPRVESVRTNWHVDFASFRQLSAQALYGKKNSRFGLGLSRLYSHIEYNWSIYEGLDFVTFPTEAPTWDRSYNVYQIVFEHDVRLNNHWCITAHSSIGFKHEDRRRFSIHDRFIIPVRLNIARDF